jgi:heme exporter protein A
MPGSNDDLPGLHVLGLSCERGGKPLFVDVDLDAEAGAVAILLGANGTGKSTLLRALAGLTEPVAGEVRWGASTVAVRSAAWRSCLAYAGHKPGHKEDLSVIENLTLACELEHVPVAPAEQLEALERVGLGRRRALQVKRLSQGQKQRLTLARLSLSRRSLWLLDEPTAALDTQGRVLLSDILGAHLTRGGVAVVATHDDIDVRGHRRVERRLG